MTNELLFFIKLLLGLSIVLFAFRMGKYWLFAVIGVFITLANIFVAKQILLFGLAATGGNVLYGCTFLITDLLSEHYSKEDARRAVMIGFFSAIIFLLMSQLIVSFQASGEDFVHDSMKNLFSLAPRIVAASMAAYLVSQLHDIWAFNFLKNKTGGKYLWLRNNISTWVSQLMDSVIFTFIAFFGVFSGDILLQIIFTTYILKIIVALIDTPFIYFSYLIKPHERKL